MFDDEVDRTHLQLLLRVARLYYVNGLDQYEVARSVGYSRPTISRLLKEARDRGIVTFNVSHPVESEMDCERRLRAKFGLVGAAVTTGAAGRARASSVGGMAARIVVEHGGANTIIALSNGSALAPVVAGMPEQRWRGSCVVQMIGMLGAVDSMIIDSPDLCRSLGDRIGGVYRSLSVPIVMTSRTAAHAMLRDESVITTLELAARADIAVCGVGTVGPAGESGSILRAFITPQIEAEVKKGKAVAHLCGHHFDARGRHVSTSLCERLMTMSPARLAEIPTSIATAWGVHKVPAIHAILQTGYINTLATDEETARALLDYRP